MMTVIKIFICMALVGLSYAVAGATGNLHVAILAGWMSSLASVVICIFLPGGR